ncbi:hypothetical protein [Burkholderia glumae]|uniref:hypothetical protein n=1 Tax=Burkholderia glumae TaxID=337 RepID=UPI0003A4D444|nr:hypothetical protein [Burkholderia glumae]KHJ62336.1 hypothetical protein NCPPB3923_14015 [Burkholderia glumae]MCM2493401.1 hypothetical protein [Burkholderia glumae]RQZ65242.1 hypothetical protein DF052_26955 [Burkholderia glumae]
MARYAYFDKQVKAVLGWIDTVAYNYDEDPVKAFPAEQMLPITDAADWHANDGKQWYVVDSKLTTTAPTQSVASSN